MVSILIPVYNYSIIELVRELLEQCKVLDCKFEIIVLDDCSSDKEISITNQVFCKENQVSYFFSEPNLGNAGARNFLAEKAHYE